MTNQITVFKADRVRTLQRALPVADAVAVRDGRVLEVGTLESLAPWLNEFDHTIDDSTFRGKTLLPGFIDPHLHPEMAAMIFLTDIVAATDWSFPWGTYPGVSGRVNYLARLTELERAKTDPDEPLNTWGYHQGWHGDVTRADLDAISATRPIFVWHRSPHEGIGNSAFIKRYRISEDLDAKTGQTDVANGKFWEMGAKAALGDWLADLSARFDVGLAKVGQAIRHAGVTTVADMSTGMFIGSTDRALAAYRAAYEQPEVPFRVVITPAASALADEYPDRARQLAYLESLLPTSSDRVRLARRIKLFADGALFGLRLQMLAPCCGSGVRPEWMTTPDELIEQAKFYWKAGYQIHVHVTGDAGTQLALDALEQCLLEQYRPDHRFTLEHFGFSTDEQVQRVKGLGAQVSVNPFYVYELTSFFRANGIGDERSSQMSRTGSLEAAGVPFALHSDLTMAPVDPLLLAWVAANRVTMDGDVVAPNERVSLTAAIRAITIDAARILRLENEIGSIAAGKRADFTALEADPWDVGVAGLRDIPVTHSVFGGEVLDAGG
ncbi:amidohydrolase [Mycobacterium shigaense]|uniref:Uncharacterized protein n=1 Tax=Mycobacterium shigaense TaxID=722731 RepID=A0A1Z4EFP0_9MYCO|nr:amidohydrolase [Mycobacterium shigaense]MEA1124800.1 amidohydrolase family protein [Mycobacterium shigaense]PRI16484.1 hypothetical protein B2J96_06860 [Mycobacterium shigaense]BAX91759.1 hypothetical protein MSG_01605 [Mycobacterium shigaense]